MESRLQGTARKTQNPKSFIKNSSHQTNLRYTMQLSYKMSGVGPANLHSASKVNPRATNAKISIIRETQTLRKTAMLENYLVESRESINPVNK